MGLFDRLRGKPKDPSQETPCAPPATEEPAADAGRSDSPASADAPKGLLTRLRQGLRRTSQLLNTDIRDLFKQEGRLVDDDFADELFAILVRTDMGTGSAGQIRDQIRSEFRGRVVRMDDVLHAVKNQLKQLMAQDETPLKLAASGPTIIMVVGVNGSGKTTSIAKLAHFLKAQGKGVVVAAADTFRAAAVEQLTVWAERIGVPIVTGGAGSDPASVAHRAVAQTLETGAEICIIDTAGRLQTQANLMNQLSKIRRVITKQVPEAPHEVLLVLDATAGQNGISQAKGFSEAAGCTGIILAKLDGTAKGGVVIPIRQQFDLPVKYVGLGEQAEDLALFEGGRFVDALLEDGTPEVRF